MEQKGKAVRCGECAGCRRSAEMSGRVAGAGEETSALICTVGSNVGMGHQLRKMCRCGKGHCKILTSMRDQSKGLRFYCCPESTGSNNHGCGMFEWVIDPEDGSTQTMIGSPAEIMPVNGPSTINQSNSLYGRGYLDAAIRGSEQQTVALKNVLAALTKLDVNQK